ncbi:uncharacterized protein K452DRAFT_322461 [Aplosporella prunicola CBS 121167]|uniref:Uncharacterized protein n=1 Tax=Aplosporella prunicola CBS 121167 TaxID=1176127 RepID=A0A6A6AYZ0_9PEZI|nr:uncharacterized protein K452DRAFT_322461 [Aplosporella prunicola CBS 121167]KAF2136413.1 hypothetical protein K452DRAFT_322461 [Aplosporella prunicola CBS 121167]
MARLSREDDLQPSNVIDMLPSDGAIVQSDDQEEVDAQLWAEQNTPRAAVARRPVSTTRPGDKTANMLNDAIWGSSGSPHSPMVPSSSRVVKQLPTEDQKRRSYEFMDQFRRQSNPESKPITSSPLYAPGKLRRPSFQALEQLRKRRASNEERPNVYDIQPSPERSPPSAQKYSIEEDEDEREEVEETEGAQPHGEVRDERNEEEEHEEEEQGTEGAEEQGVGEEDAEEDVEEQDAEEQDAEEQGAEEEDMEKEDVEEIPKKRTTRATRKATSDQQATASSEAGPAGGAIKRKRGRPSKQAAASSPQQPKQTMASSPQQPKKRGRPPKSTVAESPSTAAPKKRGRQSDSSVDVSSAPRPKKAKTTDETRASVRAKKAAQDAEPSSENGRRSSARVAEKSTQPRQVQPVEGQKTSPKKQAKSRQPPKEKATQEDTVPDTEEDGRQEDKTAVLVQDDAPQEEDGEDGEVDPALYEHRAELRAIWNNKRGVEMVRSNRKANGLQIKTKTVKTLLRKCKALNELCDGTSNPDIAEQSEEDKVKTLISRIRTSVNKMDLHDKVDLKNFLLQEIYAFVFPGLLRVLCNVVDFYVDRYRSDDNSIPTEPLETIVDFTATIIELRERLLTHPTEVPGHLRIVKPVKNGIVAPLKLFLAQLKWCLEKQRTRERNERERLHDKHRRQRMREERAREAAAREPERIRREDWRLLYIKRMELEPNKFLRYRLEGELSEHWPSNSNIDANGEPFDRVDAFNHRPEVGHRAPALSIASEPEWTDERGAALLEALAEESAKQWDNPRLSVYSQVFERLCKPGDLLWEFSAADIVRMAMHAKKMLLPQFEWMERIPEF